MPLKKTYATAIALCQIDRQFDRFLREIDTTRTDVIMEFRIRAVEMSPRHGNTWCYSPGNAMRKP